MSCCGGITGPRYFVDPKEKLVGIVFMQGPSIRAAYHAELRAMVYGALPILVEGGGSRAAAFIGVDLATDRFEVDLQTHAGLVGDPFVVKQSLRIGARF